MKIAYLVHDLDPKTGAGRFASYIVDGMKSMGHQVVVLKEVEDGREGTVVLRRGLAIFSDLNRLRGLVKDCDIIHAMDGYPFGIIAWLINMKLKKKLVISVQGTYSVAPLYRFPTSILLTRAYRAADKIISISDFTKREILKKISLSNIIVIHHGVEIKQTGKIQAKTNKRLILGVGGIKERKGYHVSLEAFARIASDFPDVRYVIVGDPHPAFQAVLDEIIRKNSLSDRVEILHHISDERLQELYNDASLFVLTPINTDDHHFEGFGLVYLEAAAAGLPVIGTRGSGAEEAIKEGYNGLLVPQKDIEATAAAMKSILSDPLKRQKMSSASYEWAESNKIENQVKKFENLYKSLYELHK